ncbi:hypothetical protein NKH77_40730 [Streptomyces sp. M19]
MTGGPDGDQPLLRGDQAEWPAHSAFWLPDGDEVLFLSPEKTCTCELDVEHVFRVRVCACSEDVPTLVVEEEREVSSPTWVGPQDGGYVVVEHNTAEKPEHVTLQDARIDGADPRDLGLVLLKEDPAANTNTDPARDPLFEPGTPTTRGPSGRTTRRTAAASSSRGSRTATTGGSNGSGRWTPTARTRRRCRWPGAGRTTGTPTPRSPRTAGTSPSPGPRRGVGSASGPGRILIADAASGAIVHEIVPPSGQQAGGDAQPTWSSDGTTLAFTRNMVIDGAAATNTCGPCRWTPWTSSAT